MPNCRQGVFVTRLRVLLSIASSAFSLTSRLDGGPRKPITLTLLLKENNILDIHTPLQTDNPTVQSLRTEVDGVWCKFHVGGVEATERKVYGMTVG
jgi:hypothetical protein